MERISNHQFVVFSAAVLLGTTFFPVAQIAVAMAGRDAWWAVLPGYGLAIPFGLIVLSLSKKHPGEDLLQITVKLIGKWPAKGIAIMYSLSTGYLGVLLLAQTGDTFRRSILPLVPSLVIMGGTMLLAMMLVWSGIEVYARFIEVTFPLVIGSLLFTMGFSIPRFEWGEFFPIFADGLMPVFFGVLKLSPFAMEYVLVLGSILPYLPLRREKRLKTGLIWAVMLVGLTCAALTLTEIMVFGPVEAQRLNYGLLSLGKMIEISKTISGIESIFMLIWMSASIIKIAALFGVSLIGVQQVTGWKKSLWLYFGAAVIFVGIALTKRGGTALVLEVDKVDNYLILPFAIFWVLFLVFTERLKRRLKQG